MATVQPKLTEEQAYDAVTMLEGLLESGVRLDRHTRHNLEAFNERTEAALRQAKQFNANQRARIQRLQAAA